MKIILLSFFSIIIFIRRKFNKKELFIIYTVFFFYLFIVLNWFHIIKFNGEFKLLFPDEKTYLSFSEVGGFFGKYLKIIDLFLGVEFQKIINIATYLYIIIYFCRKTNYSYNYLNLIIIIIISSVGSYWSFFLLKEPLAIAGQILLISYLYTKNIRDLLIGTIILSIGRTEFVLLFFATKILIYFYLNNRYLFILVLIGIFFTVYDNFSTEFFNKIKLYSMSKRFGESNKVYDKEMYKVLDYNLFKFIFSKPYLETLRYNINNSFNPFFLHGFAKLLILINTISLSYVFLNIKKLIKQEYFFYFIVPFITIIFTHSTYRYINSLFIPYMLVFCLNLKSKGVRNVK